MPTLAQQYGERFAAAHEAHYSAVMVIKEFTDAHPLFIPDPNMKQPEGGPVWMIASPVDHEIYRHGDELTCVSCDVTVHAPVPPRRPLTPQEASLSRFD